VQNGLAKLIYLNYMPKWKMLDLDAIYTIIGVIGVYKGILNNSDGNKGVLPLSFKLCVFTCGIRA